MTDHCENCGRVNPTTDDGYTTCCNELVCDGGYDNVFGTEAVNVHACCWFEAEHKFAAQGIAVPEGSSRIG